MRSKYKIPHYLMGGLVRYRPSELSAWAARSTAAQGRTALSGNHVGRHNGQKASQQRFSHVGSFSMVHRTSSISMTRPTMLPCVRRV